VSANIAITLNGEPRTVAAGLTVAALLGELELHPCMVVVEHNREILDRHRYDAVEVGEGDSMVPVHFVGVG